MIKKLQTIIAFAMLFSITSINASVQKPDYVILNNDTIPTYNLILEKYLQNKKTDREEKLFGLSFREESKLNCWRGYQAIYKIENDSLFLVDIIKCGEIKYAKFEKELSLKKIQNIFGNKVIDGKVFIDWFDGNLNFSNTNQVIRFDGVFYKIHEKEIVIRINNGQVINVEQVVNYIDDPNRIDRRNKSNIKETLIKIIKEKEKKLTVISEIQFFKFTINEQGIISNITYIDKNGKKETNIENEQNEIFIAKLLKTCKKLKFDIIKDKGIPISEDIDLAFVKNPNGEIIIL